MYDNGRPAVLSEGLAKHFTGGRARSRPYAVPVL
jgi:hypothetical protein